MFVVIYQGSNDPVSLAPNKEGINLVGAWRVDTAENGGVATYDDVDTALDRVRYIREHGGEACLSVIIE